MSETQIIVEETNAPLVVEIIDETVEVVADSVQETTVEILSGAKGVTTQWLLGALSPQPSDGTIGDIWLVTQGLNAGDVYKKLSNGTWEPNGSIRGAGYGITDINGDLGPVVILTKEDVGLANVDNTSDANKPVSTAQQTAINLKANIASPTFTGTVGGITKAMVGLTNVDDTSDANKPISTATQTALNTKVSMTANETIAGNKTFSAVVSIGNANNLRIGTSTTARNVLMADVSGYATWGNPMLIAANKAETDNASTYTQQGTYIQDSATGGGWPVSLGTIQTSFLNTNRGFQILVEKSGTNKFLYRSADSAASNGWMPWTTVANDAAVVHLTGAETVAGVKTFSSSPIVPTPTTSTQAANKAYVDGIVDAAPGTLDTLNELAAALGDDANFATTVTNSIATKEPIINAGTTAQYWRGDKTWQALNSVTVDLTTTQTVGGIKSFSTDTYMTKVKSNSTVTTQTDATLGSVAGDILITRKHFHVGATNTFTLVDMVHRRAAGSDWITTQQYQGIGVDSSYLDSPTTGASKLRTWIMRDPNGSSIAIGDAGNTFLTLTNTAVTIGGGAFTGNGSGLTTLNGTNISSGTVADARLSANVVLLTGSQTLTGQKTFTGQTILKNDVAGGGSGSSSLQIQNDDAAGKPSIWFRNPGQVGANIVLNLSGEFTIRTADDTAYATLKAGALYDGDNRVYSASNPPLPANLPTTVVYRVVHNGTSWPARPTGATCVEWVGPVVPTAATANDTWTNSTL